MRYHKYYLNNHAPILLLLSCTKFGNFCLRIAGIMDIRIERSIDFIAIILGSKLPKLFSFHLECFLFKAQNLSPITILQTILRFIRPVIRETYCSYEGL